MNYLLFNNDILMSDGVDVRRVEKGDEAGRVLGAIDSANVCVVDVDVLIAVAPEGPIEKKDSLLVRKFKEFYQHEPYVIQDEHIDNNLFQIIGIKEKNIREVYSMIPPEKVVAFIPYGVALRNTLANNHIDLNKTTVFVDVLDGEKLLTVFDGLKFSRTRAIADDGENILPEIKRSRIDFFKKNEEHLNKKDTDFTILVNDQNLAREISKNEEKLHVEYLGVKYPAIEGLKGPNTSIKYRLPEEALKKRREIELKKKVNTSVLSLGIIAAGFLYFLFNQFELSAAAHQCASARELNKELNDQLSLIDKETYRQDLRVQKYLNYGVSYLSMLELLPAAYTVNSFKFFKTGKWNLEANLFADDDGLFDPIPRTKILKNAEIKDIFVNDQPGKHLKITL